MVFKDIGDSTEAPWEGKMPTADGNASTEEAVRGVGFESLEVKAGDLVVIHGRRQLCPTPPPLPLPPFPPPDQNVRAKQAWWGFFYPPLRTNLANRRHTMPMRDTAPSIC